MTHTPTANLLLLHTCTMVPSQTFKISCTIRYTSTGTATCNDHLLFPFSEQAVANEQSNWTYDIDKHQSFQLGKVWKV